jgi:SAM-dependent methyltransferase
MRNSKERFSDRVEHYVRYRPRYPRALMTVLSEEIGLDPQAVVADIGSGTGFSAEPFLEGGHRVVAIEPNDEMRRAAERLYGDRAGFASAPGSAEATGLEGGSVDLVVCAQAFHWFDPGAARAEFERILRPPKWVALIWNRRLTNETAFLREYETLLERFGTDYSAVRHERIDESVLGPFFAGGYVRRGVPNQQLLDYEALEGRVLSSSYTPPAGHPDHRPMLAALRALFEAHHVGGEVTMLYETEIHVGRLG